MKTNSKPTLLTINPSNPWYEVLKDEWSAVYYKGLVQLSDKTTTIPPRPLVFRALEEILPQDVRVVILGQDPYPSKNKAIGRAFAVPYHWPKINSSLENILKEIERTEGRRPKDLTFQKWVDQGVLLLNTRLTVEEEKPMSHAGMGWEILTGKVLEHLDSLPNPPIVLAWGREARLHAKKHMKKSIILETSHPCKFSAHLGFSGCGHFRKVNEILRAKGLEEIRWIGIIY